MVRSGGYIEVKPQYFEQIPIPRISEESRASLEEITEEMLWLNQELQTLQSKFKRTLEREFNLQKPTKKLQDWHNLTYTDFIKELTKQKIALTLAQKAEWEDYYAQEQHKAQTLQTQIQQTDQQIDHMVYQLYGLTNDDIAIIEAN